HRRGVAAASAAGLLSGYQRVKRAEQAEGEGRDEQLHAHGRLLAVARRLSTFICATRNPGWRPFSRRRRERCREPDTRSGRGTWLERHHLCHLRHERPVKQAARRGIAPLVEDEKEVAEAVVND